MRGVVSRARGQAVYTHFQEQVYTEYDEPDTIHPSIHTYLHTYIQTYSQGNVQRVCERYVIVIGFVVVSVRVELQSSSQRCLAVMINGHFPLCSRERRKMEEVKMR